VTAELLYPFPYFKPSFIGLDELDLFGAEQIELPDKYTPMTADEVAKAVSAAFKQMTGKAPSKKILALLLAQWALESANGRAVHNFNLTNIKRNSGDPYFQYFRCSEIIDGVEQFFDPPNPQCAFAAYKTAVEGAKAYIRILKKRPNWWNGLLTGDVGKFNAGLSTTPKFYTANPSLYLKLLNDRMAKYLPQAQKYGASLLGAFVSAVFGIAVGGAILYYGPPAYQKLRHRRAA
jgi:hypothetical protein